MDSLTQIVLGASVAEATLGKKIGNKAIVLGAIAGTIPDLDIVTRFFVDDLTASVMHRGFSHSLIFPFVAAPILAWILKKIYSNNTAYKKAGIILMGLSPESSHQYSLFDETTDRQKKLMKSFDSIDSKYGAFKVRLASQDQKRIWKMRRQKLSRNYTTEIDEVLIVK